MKKKLVHIIFDLGRGGAETMLVSVVKGLPEYENIIITLFSNNHFKDELKCDQLYNLNLRIRDLFFFPLVVLKLRKLFKQIGPDIIHTHLYWPTALTRMAAPKSVPVVTTIHSVVSQMLDYKKWYLKAFDRFTYKLRPTVIIGVSQGALNEYYSFLKVRRYKSYCLYTFVDITKFKPGKSRQDNGILKLVAIGALRNQKNHFYMLQSFQKVNRKDIQLDIFGGGPLENEIKEFIAEQKISNVRLMGQITNVESQLSNYDVFVMASEYEGFALSVLEAMAMGIPLLISDISSFREQCEGTAVYFKLDDVNDFSRKLQWMQENKEEVNKMSEAAFERVNKHFTLNHYLENLKGIYKEVLDKGL